MPMYRVTTWPGTDRMPSDWAKQLSPETIKKLEVVRTIEARDYSHAQMTMLYLDPTSDGCLIEEVVEGIAPQTTRKD